MTNNIKWSDFPINYFGKIKSGEDITKNNFKLKNGKIPYITSSKVNNGVNTFLENTNKTLESKCISINRTGSVGYSFYHEYSALFSNNCRKISLNFENDNVALFLVNQIKLQSEKYKYGYILGTKRIQRQKLLIPINEKNEPYYEYMDTYIKEIKNKKISKYKQYCENKLKNIEYKEIKELNNKEWKSFKIEDIFDVYSGKDIYKSERKLGVIPYISASSENNGITHLVSNTNKTLESNCISVNRNGSVGHAFYHPYNALYSNDCRKIKLKRYHENEYISLFIVNQIKKQKEIYGYGYKLGTARLKNTKIMLPINDANQPDYEYMEQYIKNIMYKKYNKYLEYIEEKYPKGYYGERNNTYKNY